MRRQTAVGHDSRAAREDGFSILEMLVAMGVMMVVTAGVFSIMNPSQGTFQTQTEASDLQQRRRPKEV